MKKIILTLAIAISFALSGSAFAVSVIEGWTPLSANKAATATADDLVGGIVWSRHNLSSYGEHLQATTSVITTVGGELKYQAQTVITTEVCVFCHTPHFGRTDTAPLWNRGTSMTGFTAYGSTLATKSASATGVSGSSLACLSCHDGVTTLDNIINKPGKGSRTNATGADQGWIFGAIGPYDTEGASSLTGKLADRLNIGAGTDEARDAGNVDLRNDHPIGITYNQGVAASLRDTSTIISSLTMANARDNGDNTNRSYFGKKTNLWAVYGYLKSDATIADLLRTNNTKVECASCHDPHYKNQSNTDPAVVCAGCAGEDLLNANGERNTPDPDNNGDGILDNGTGGIDDDDGTDADKAANIVGAAGADPETDIIYQRFVTDIRQDGLFLRRVGGNSNSGVCRTCHAK